jgi:hypothetical protein
VKDLTSKGYGRLIRAYRHNQRPNTYLVHHKPVSRNSMRYKSSGMWAVIDNDKLIRRKPYRGKKTVYRAPMTWANQVLVALDEGGIQPASETRMKLVIFRKRKRPARQQPPPFAEWLLEGLYQVETKYNKPPPPPPWWAPQVPDVEDELPFIIKSVEEDHVEKPPPGQLFSYGGSCDFEEMPARLNFGPRNKRDRRAQKRWLRDLAWYRMRGQSLDISVL